MHKTALPSPSQAQLLEIDEHLHTKPEQAYALSEQLLASSRQQHNPMLFMQAAVRYGILMDHLGRSVEARNILFEALQHAQSGHHFDYEAQLLEQIARSYYSAGIYHESIQYWGKAAEIADQIEGIAGTWILAKIGLAQVYFALDDFESGLVLLKEGETRIVLQDDLYLSAKLEINLGVALEKRGQHQDALEVLHTAVEICENHRYLDYAAESHFRLGQVYLALDEKDQALAHLEKAGQFAKTVNYRWGYTNILATQAEVQARLGHFELAMRLIHEAQDISRQDNFLHMLIDQHLAAARFAQAMGDSNIALAEFLAGRSCEQKVMEGASRRKHKELEEQSRFSNSPSARLVALSNHPEIENARLQHNFELIAREACSILRADRASIWQLNDIHTVLHCRTLFSASTSYILTDLNITETDAPRFFAWFRETLPLVAHNAMNHPFTFELSETYLTPHAVASMLGQHIEIGSQSSTFLCIESCHKQRNWTQDEVDHCRQIVSILGRALVCDERKHYQEKIGALNAQLLHINAKLESRVAERTAALEHRNIELSNLNLQLTEMQNQLLQSEKMASIGQLAAGVAHEINNPIGFISSNLSSLESAAQSLLALLREYEIIEAELPENGKAKIAKSKQAYDYEYLQEDVPQLIFESKEGIARVTKIVKDLREFSHVDSDDKGFHDINQGILSTLTLVNKELQEKAKITTDLGEIPLVECALGRLNQVFLNLLVNAGHAVEHSQGEIKIVTRTIGEEVRISISDNGCGIKQKDLNRIFDAFYTTKPIGQGTGLGLSLSYSIVQTHQGRIEVDSVEGHGTQFHIWLPLTQNKNQETL